jgi:hypothetical protein
MMDSGPDLLLLWVLSVGAAILLIVIWQLFVTWRARAALAREDVYRELSARAVTAQERADRRLEEIAAQLTAMRATLESIQRTLSVVE